MIYKNKFEWSANRTEFRQPLWVNDKVTENKWNNIIAMFTNDMHKNVTPRHKPKSLEMGRGRSGGGTFNIVFVWWNKKRFWWQWVYSNTISLTQIWFDSCTIICWWNQVNNELWNLSKRVSWKHYIWGVTWYYKSSTTTISNCNSRTTCW